LSTQGAGFSFGLGLDIGGKIGISESAPKIGFGTSWTIFEFMSEHSGSNRVTFLGYEFPE
jgi:hypothetical protein